MYVASLKQSSTQPVRDNQYLQSKVTLVLPNSQPRWAVLLLLYNCRRFKDPKNRRYVILYCTPHALLKDAFQTTAGFTALPLFLHFSGETSSTSPDFLTRTMNKHNAQLPTFTSFFPVIYDIVSGKKKKRIKRSQKATGVSRYENAISRDLTGLTVPAILASLC